MSTEDLPLARLRLGERSTEQLVSALLTKFISALVVGDAALVEHCCRALDASRQGCIPLVNSKVATPWGGALLFPLQAAVCAPLEPNTALMVAQRLLDLGADPGIRWRDCGGEHAPLSKALVLRNFPLAELLAQRGADCTAALLGTDLLESSRFDPMLVQWLLDRGADVATPVQPSCSGGKLGCSHWRGSLPSCPDSSGASASVSSSSSTSSSSSSGRCKTGSCCCPAVPAVAVVLRKLQTELHVSRQLSKLHAAAGTGQEQWLLRRAADVLTLLLAAGAAPVGAPDPSGVTAAAVDAMQPSDWEVVRPYASCPPVWSPATHHLFPRPFQIAAKQLLLIGQRGFTVSGQQTGGDGHHLSSSGGNGPGGTSSTTSTSSRGGSGSLGAGSSSGSGSHEAGSSLRAQQPHAATTYWLDGNVVLNLVKHLAPRSQ